MQSVDDREPHPHIYLLLHLSQLKYPLYCDSSVNPRFYFHYGLLRPPFAKPSAPSINPDPRQYPEDHSSSKSDLLQSNPISRLYFFGFEPTTLNQKRLPRSRKHPSRSLLRDGFGSVAFEILLSSFDGFRKRYAPRYADRQSRGVH